MSERRKLPRLNGPFPAIIIGSTEREQTLGVPATLENVSAGGFYLRTRRPHGVGEGLLVITKLSQAVVLLHGCVTRVEQADGVYGLAASVARHQIFSLKTDFTQARISPTAAA